LPITVTTLCDDDIKCEIRNLYTRTNILLQQFGKRSTAVIITRMAPIISCAHLIIRV